MDKKTISEAIEQYLKTENTDFAIMLKGPWGSGKTYYAKTQLRHIVETQKHLEAQKLCFAYVSLYGVRTCREIHDRILSAIYPLRQTNTFKVGKAVVGAVFRHDNIDIIVQELNINMTRIVLVFDDLERKSDSADIVNILGCINNYVEHKQVKTIIICDEDKIIDNKYESTKEKIVRFTYLYEPDVQDIVDKLITQYKDTEPDLYAALFRNRSYLLYIALIRGKGLNIRTLQAIMGSFRAAINYIQRKDYKVEHFDYFVDAIFRCLVGFQYEKNVNAKDRKTLEDLCKPDFSLMSLSFRKRIASSGETHSSSKYEDAEKFYRDYYPGNTNPYISMSMCNIAFDRMCNSVDLNSECASFIKERYSADKAMILLSDYWGMSDMDFDEAVREWIRRLHDNNIDNVVLLLRVISYLCYFIEQGLVVGHDCNELRVQGVNRLRTIAADRPSDFVASVDSPLGVDSLPAQSEVSQMLLAEVKNIAKPLREEVIKNEARETWERIINSRDSAYFYEVFGISSKWARAPFFALLDNGEFVRSFNTMSSKLIENFGGLVKARYGSGNVWLLDTEYRPLMCLKKHLEDHLITAGSGKKRTLHMFVCGQLFGDISNVLDSYKPPEGNK